MGAARKPEWTEKRSTRRSTASATTIYVKLERPITVTIMYTTAVARDNGDVHFFDDIYGHDVQLAQGARAAEQLAPR